MVNFPKKKRSKKIKKESYICIGAVHMWEWRKHVKEYLKETLFGVNLEIIKTRTVAFGSKKRIFIRARFAQYFKQLFEKWNYIGLVSGY